MSHISRNWVPGELFLGEILRLPARADVVSEFPEGARRRLEAMTRQGVGGWHPQTLAECGLSDHGL